ncbi:MAG: peptidylprolyl isomerase [Bacteroidales bacterium]
MRSILLILVFILVVLAAWSQKTDDIQNQSIVIATTLGDIEIALYDDTPLHKKNMIKLIREGFYDDQLFHRVIKNFMIQGGDPHSAGSPKGQRLGTGGPGYRIPAEFRDHYFHKKGALAAARQGDSVNPDKESSGSQFYLVHGQVFNKDQLMMLQSSGKQSPFTPEQIEAYTTLGGAPHLDGSYTVFGEVTRGLDVIDSIAAVKTDNYDRPVKDVVYTIRLK